MNPNYCQVCGRRLYKSQFIGPGCMRKRRKYKPVHRMNKQAYIKYARSNDIFYKEEDSGSEEASKTSENPEK